MPDQVTLDTIGGGALLELFQAELARVLTNITDPNTDEKQKREISIKVRFKPNRDRDIADIELACSSKLAGIRTVSGEPNAGGCFARRDSRERPASFAIP